MLEHLDQPRCREWTLACRNFPKRIKAIGLSRIRYVEVDNIVYSLGRNSRFHSVHKIAVRVHQGEAFALFEVIQHERLEKCRLAGSGLAKNVNVSTAILLLDAER